MRVMGETGEIKMGHVRRVREGYGGGMRRREEHGGETGERGMGGGRVRERWEEVGLQRN